MTHEAPPLQRSRGVSDARPSVWLYGRGTDLLLGYGLGYLIGIPLLLALGSATYVPGVMLFSNASGVE